MINFEYITAFLNVITILFLLVGLFVKFENPKQKAAYGYVLAAGMIPFLAALSIFIIMELITKQNIAILLLILCVLSPFIIGKLVKYETLNKYTIIQILCFCVSLAVLVS